MYADTITGAMKRAMDEMNRRRKKQLAYNKKHGITARSIQKAVPDLLGNLCERDYVTLAKAAETPDVYVSDEDFNKTITKLRKQMKDAAARLEFEQAAQYRDRLLELERRKVELGL